MRNIMKVDTAGMPETAIEYWSRSFGVCLRTSHCGTTQMFNTMGDAIKYVFSQYAHVERDINSGSYGSSWANFDCWRTTIHSEAGVIQAAYVLFVDELQSH